MSADILRAAVADDSWRSRLASSDFTPASVIKRAIVWEFWKLSRTPWTTQAVYRAQTQAMTRMMPTAISRLSSLLSLGFATDAFLDLGHLGLAASLDVLEEVV